VHKLDYWHARAWDGKHVGHARLLQQLTQPADDAACVRERVCGAVCVCVCV
jgi:hypothetical protein